MTNVRLVPDGAHERAPLVDEENFRSAQRGERPAQDLVFQALYPVVRKQLYFQLGNTTQENLEEAVQDSMVSIFRGLSTFRGEAKLTTWALGIAIREGRRHAGRWRKERTVPFEDGAANGFVAAPPSETATRLARMVPSLKAKKREAFILMEIFELTAAEAGIALKVSANTAASRCRHAKDELRRGLSK